MYSQPDNMTMIIGNGSNTHCTAWMEANLKENGEVKNELREDVEKQSW